MRISNYHTSIIFLSLGVFQFSNRFIMIPIKAKIFSTKIGIEPHSLYTYDNLPSLSFFGSSIIFRFSFGFRSFRFIFRKYNQVHHKTNQIIHIMFRVMNLKIRQKEAFTIFKVPKKHTH